MRRCAMNLAESLLVIVVLFASCAWGQGYPNKPVKLIVPMTPGGGNDIIGRTLAQPLQERLHQPIVIENRPGAGGNVGTEFVARAPADGYTLLLVSNAQVMNPWLYKQLPFDIIRDFSPVAMLAALPMLVLTNPSLPVKSIAELIAYAHANPGTLSYASPGTGTPHHLATELFKKMTGIDMVHVPYKGGAPAVTALIAGEVQVMFGVVATTMPHIKAGKLRALATAEAKRIPMLPDLPPVAETGIEGFSVGIWYGIMAPAGTPAGVVSRLSEETRRVLELPEIRERLLAQGFVITYQDPNELRSAMVADYDKWGKIIREAGIKSAN
jgi:tripartite-type tricarboxylate transporter receptor subunit TctC